MLQVYPFEAFVPSIVSIIVSQILYLRLIVIIEMYSFDKSRICMDTGGGSTLL